MIGYIESDIQSCPLPTLIWTLLFGIILGVTLTLIERYFIHISNVVAITIYEVAVIMIVIGVIGNRKVRK